MIENLDLVEVGVAVWDGGEWRKGDLAYFMYLKYLHKYLLHTSPGCKHSLFYPVIYFPMGFASRLQQ